MNPEWTAEQRRFNQDRFGSRLLLMTIDQVPRLSLRRFLHQVTGDPVIGQIVVAQQAGVYNVCLLRRSARRAAGKASVQPDERDAVFAAAFVARLGDMADALARQWRSLATPAPELHRRWHYLLGVALRRLQAEDAPNACLLQLALGCPMPDEGRAVASARLQTAVSLAWTELCARFPGYHRPRAPLPGLADGAEPPLQGAS